MSVIADTSKLLAEVLGATAAAIGVVPAEHASDALVERAIGFGDKVAIQLVEAKPKNPAQLQADREITVRGQTYGARKGLEGPFHYKSGRVLYYDPKEGQYLDPTRDMYLDVDDVIEAQATPSGVSLHEDVRAALGQFSELSGHDAVVPEAMPVIPQPLTEAGVRGNPYHSASDGKFTSVPDLQRAGKGSFSKKKTPKSKSKVKGAGKNGRPKFARTPTLCGRTARAAGRNILCHTGKPADGRPAPQRSSGRGRGWRKGQNDRAGGRRLLRRESSEVEFKPRLVEDGAQPIAWDLQVEDRRAEVEQTPTGFEWAVYWEDGEGDEEVMFGHGFAESLEDAWSDSAYKMGVRVRDLSEAKITISGSKGDFDSIDAEFGGDATFKRSGNKLVISGDRDVLKRIKQYCDDNLGVDVQESDDPRLFAKLRDALLDQSEKYKFTGAARWLRDIENYENKGSLNKKALKVLIAALKEAAYVKSPGAAFTSMNTREVSRALDSLADDEMQFDESDTYDAGKFGLWKFTHFSGNPSQVAKFKKHADPSWELREPKDGGIDVAARASHKSKVIDAADDAGLILDESDLNEAVNRESLFQALYSAVKAKAWLRSNTPGQKKLALSGGYAKFDGFDLVLTDSGKKWWAANTKSTSDGGYMLLPGARTEGHNQIAAREQEVSDILADERVPRNKREAAISAIWTAYFELEAGSWRELKSEVEDAMQGDAPDLDTAAWKAVFSVLHGFDESDNDTDSYYVLQKLYREFPDVPKAEVREIVGSVSPRMSADAKKIQKRYKALMATHHESATERDLDHDKKIVATGTKGMKSKSFTKTFKNMKAYEKWADSEAADDYSVQRLYNEDVSAPRWVKEPGPAPVTESVRAIDKLRALVG